MNIYSANITVVIKDKPLQTKVFESSPFIDGKTVYRGYRIIKVEKIKVIGKTNRTDKYTIAVANDEKRNNITGAYE